MLKGGELAAFSSALPHLLNDRRIEEGSAVYLAGLGPEHAR